ncbi:hypothetical protein BSKO_06710 [Bryopsis sp. KO-2023]|nr:hypothetical protein BSKO_06710 [Bryopsis sp. KO-2023]
MIYSSARRRVLRLLVIWAIATGASAKLWRDRDRLAHAYTGEDFHASFSPKVLPLIDMLLVSKDLKFDYIFMLPQLEIKRDELTIKSDDEGGKTQVYRKIHLVSVDREPSLILQSPTTLTVEKLAFVVPPDGLDGAFDNVWKVESGASVLFRDCVFYLEGPAFAKLSKDHGDALRNVYAGNGKEMHAEKLTIYGITGENVTFKKNDKPGKTEIDMKTVSQNHDMSWLYDLSQSTSTQLHIHLRTNVTVYACDVMNTQDGMPGPILAGRPIMFHGYNTGLRFDSKLAYQGFLEIRKYPVFFRNMRLDFQDPDMDIAKGIVQCNGWGCHNIEAIFRLNSKGEECMLDVVDSHFVVPDQEGGDMVDMLLNEMPLLDTSDSSVMSEETVVVHSMMSSGKCFVNTTVTSDRSYKVHDTADAPDCDGMVSSPSGMLPLHVVLIVILVVGILGGGFCLLGLIIISKTGADNKDRKRIDRLKWTVCQSLGRKTTVPDSIVASPDPEMGVYAPQIDLDFKLMLDQAPLWILEKICDESNYRRDRSVVMGQRIAEGGYGVVFKGTWKGLPVAIKTVLFRDKGDQTENKERSRAVFEAAISSSVAHPNIVQTYAFSFKRLGFSESPGGAAGHSVQSDSNGGIKVASSSEKVRWEIDDPEALVDWKLYMVQELCNAGSVRAALKKQVFMNVASQPNMNYLLRLALDIARGMLHLHRHNIIHGDLTSKNILLRKETNQDGGIDLTGKIADFGLSVKMDQSQNQFVNQRAGTPFYMAPEIVQKGLLSKKADVFAFGVVMWELYHSQECYEPKLDENGKKSESLGYHNLFPKFPVTCPMPFAMLCVACVSPNPDDRPDFPIVVQVLKALLLKLKAGDYSSPAAIRKENLETSTAIGKISGQQILEIVARQLGIDIHGTVASRSVDTVNLGQTGVSLGIAPFYWPSEVHVSMNQTFLALNATIVSDVDTTQDENKFELASFNYDQDEGAPADLTAESWDNQCMMGLAGGSTPGFDELDDGLESWGEGPSLDVTFEQFLKAENASDQDEGPSFGMGLGRDLFPMHSTLASQKYGSPSEATSRQMGLEGSASILGNLARGVRDFNRQSDRNEVGLPSIRGSPILEEESPVGPLDDLLRRHFSRPNVEGNTVIDIPTGPGQSRQSPSVLETSGPENTESDRSSASVKAGASEGTQIGGGNPPRVDLDSMLNLILGRNRNSRVSSASLFCEGERSEPEAAGPTNEPMMGSTFDFQSAESTRSTN